MEKRALGKGISALIPEKETPAQGRIIFLKPAQIKPNPLHPRENFDQQGMEDLVQSIREKGVIQPILVRQRSDYFELIAGERRFRAANILNLNELPAIVKEVDDRDSLEISLIENMQRQDLNPIEEARAFKYLLEKFQMTQEQVSEVLGKSNVTISNMLRLLKLPQEVQDEIRNSRISYGHGRVLLEIDDPNLQRKLAQEIISNGLSVRELENLVKRHRPRMRKISMRREVHPDSHLATLEEELRHALATKVKIIKGKKRGQITIEFYSKEDLERILQR
ncbi:MAG: ParB/RepB/Spo0J family partition protein, partial [Candidatus Omnitrophica bacterium]|nr:ParB/RepB/Spo0J family partition protein [Candidatus Omnitrophota bacterium]